MGILVAGGVLILVGAFTIRFPLFIEALKEKDYRQWEILGCPPSYSFSKSIGVFSWILSRGYEQSENPQIVELGRQAFKKALFAKYALQCGVALLVVGGIAQLIQVSAH